MEQSAAQTGVENRLQHIGEAILVMVGAYLCVAVVVSLLDPLLARVVDPGAQNTVTIIQTVVQFIVIMAVVAWYVRVIDTDHLISAVVPSRRGLGLIVGGTLLLLGGQYAINQILQWANVSPGANQAVVAGAGDPVYFLIMIPISLLLVGPAEELLFRGAVQGRLSESWDRWPAILVATVLFGLIHIPGVVGGFGAQLSYALLAGVLGIVLGYAYEYTNNIVVPACMHGCYNAVLYGLLYLGEIGVVG